MSGFGERRTQQNRTIVDLLRNVLVMLASTGGVGSGIGKGPVGSATAAQTLLASIMTQPIRITH